jgi:hypothetical protein
MRCIVGTFAILLVAARLAGAQSGASIGGVVRDSAGVPAPNADVVVVPGPRHARTDSTGHFLISALGAGRYTVRARRFGYTPAEWTVELSKTGHADVTLVLGAKVASLDTVVVSADHTCPRTSEGFLCRRSWAKGVFLDYTDIDDKDAVSTGDLFRDIEGMRIDLRRTRSGLVRVGAGKWCTRILLDGWPSSWDMVPQNPYDLVAIEIYKNPKDVPKELGRFFQGAGLEPCTLIAYWTVNFSRPLGRVRIP